MLIFSNCDNSTFLLASFPLRPLLSTYYYTIFRTLFLSHHSLRQEQSSVFILSYLSRFNSVLLPSKILFRRDYQRLTQQERGRISQSPHVQSLYEKLGLNCDVVAFTFSCRLLQLPMSHLIFVRNFLYQSYQLPIWPVKPPL